MYVWKVLLILVLSVSLVSGAGHPDVSVVAYPSFSTEPASIRLTVRIEPHPDNRYVRLDWDSDVGQAGAREWPIDGETAPTSTHWLRDVPAGLYGVVVQVVRADGKVKVARAAFEVLSRR